MGCCCAAEPGWCCCGEGSGTLSPAELIKAEFYRNQPTSQRSLNDTGEERARLRRVDEPGFGSAVDVITKLTQPPGGTARAAVRGSRWRRTLNANAK